MAECGPQPPGAGGGGGGGGGGGSGGAGAPSRHEKSLGLLTTKFVSLLQEAKDGVLDLKLVRGRRRLGRPGRGHCCMRGGGTWGGRAARWGCSPAAALLLLLHVPHSVSVCLCGPPVLFPSDSAAFCTVPSKQKEGSRGLLHPRHRLSSQAVGEHWVNVLFFKILTKEPYLYGMRST